VEQGQTVVCGGGAAGELRVGCDCEEGLQGVQVAELHRAEQVVLLAAVAAAADAVAHRGRGGKVGGGRWVAGGWRVYLPPPIPVPPPNWPSRSVYPEVEVGKRRVKALLPQGARSVLGSVPSVIDEIRFI